MLRIKKLIWMLTFCLLVISSVVATDIFISPIDTYINEGDNFTITININSPNIFAAEFELYFNNTLLNVFDVEEEDLLNKGEINSTYCFMTEHFPSQFEGKKCYDIDNTNGKISFVNTRLSNTSVSGPGSLAKIIFLAKSGGTISLDLQNVKVLELVNFKVEETTNLSVSDGNVYVDLLKTIYVSLKEGWNLISAPVKLLNNSINSVFDHIISIYGYKNNSWFIPEMVDNKLGYWVKADESTNLTIIGTEIENKTINLNDGWNLIGYPYLEEKNIPELYTNARVYAYNNSQWYSYNPDKPSNTLTKFTPGYGYWINQQ